MLVSPATNAISEISFSALCGLKTWPCTTISRISKRLSLCIVLHVYKEKKKQIYFIVNIGNEFASCNNSRMHIFGQLK